MKHIALWLILSGMACGQTVPTSVTATILHCPFNEVIQKTATGEACVIPAPLKCGKYEHVDPGVCHASSQNPNVICDKPHCVDTTHTVTEKEWQELMSRLKALERGK